MFSETLYQCALPDDFSLHLGEATNFSRHGYWYLVLLYAKYIHPRKVGLNCTHTVSFTLQNMQWTLFIIIIALK